MLMRCFNYAYYCSSSKSFISINIYNKLDTSDFYYGLPNNSAHEFKAKIAFLESIYKSGISNAIFAGALYI